MNIKEKTCVELLCATFQSLVLFCMYEVLLLCCSLQAWIKETKGLYWEEEAMVERPWQEVFKCMVEELEYCGVRFFMKWE